MKIEIIPLKALRDNYIWMICNQRTRQAICVDPGESMPVITFLEQRDFTLDAILITHHHWDHTSGIADLVQRYGAPVYAPALAKLDHCDFYLNDNEVIMREMLGGRKFETLCIPGHTLSHIALYSPGWLFCGDTLFSGGCGRVFEGTMAQMHQSLQRLTALPDDTKVYCGHEYTLDNLRFAKHVEPNNTQIDDYILKVSKRIKDYSCSLPSTIGQEKIINPFLRTHHPDVKNAAECYADRELITPTDVFSVLRNWKDEF